MGKKGSKVEQMPNTSAFYLAKTTQEELDAELIRRGCIPQVKREAWASVRGEMAALEHEVTFLRTALTTPVEMNQRYAAIGELLGIKEQLELMQRRDELSVDDKLLIGEFFI